MYDVECREQEGDGKCNAKPRMKRQSLLLALGLSLEHVLDDLGLLDEECTDDAVTNVVKRIKRAKRLVWAPFERVHAQVSQLDQVEGKRSRKEHTECERSWSNGSHRRRARPTSGAWRAWRIRGGGEP